MLYYWRFVATIQHSVRYAVLLTTSQDSNFVIDARLLKLILQPNWGCLLTVGTSHILFSSTWFNASIAFEARSGASHCLHAQEWQRLPEGDREEFFKNHRARYFELSRSTPSAWRLLILCIIFFWVSYSCCLLLVLTQILFRHREDPLAECMGSR